MVDPTVFKIGDSVSGKPLLAYRFDFSGPDFSEPQKLQGGERVTSAPEVLVLGGVHGDEKEGVICAMGLIEHLKLYPVEGLRITLIPVFNPDGWIGSWRVNGNGVDLNRNLPTADWTAEVSSERYHPGPAANSEPETQALVQWLAKTPPHWLLSLHSWYPLLNVNGACEEEALAIQARNGYRIEKSIGYPTPGCLGTYAGLERAIPTLTYEIERGQKPDILLEQHLPGILAAFAVVREKSRKPEKKQALQESKKFVKY